MCRLRSLIIFTAMTFAAALLLSASVMAASPARWLASPGTGCKVWDADPGPDDQIQWDGPCVNGYAQGHGTLKWSSQGKVNETDVGDLVGGILSGHVTITASNWHFDGEFKDNLPNGQGTATGPDGKTYAGQWAAGCHRDGTTEAAVKTSVENCQNGKVLPLPPYTPPVQSGDFTFAYQVCTPDNPGNCSNSWLYKSSIHPAQGPVETYDTGAPAPRPSVFLEYEHAVTSDRAAAPTHAGAYSIRTAVDCATGEVYWWRGPQPYGMADAWISAGSRGSIKKDLAPYSNLLKMICGG
jgi:hypothetical protein